MTDIHNLKMAEEALREADRRKDEFLATLAHELRNPLAPVRNSLHILRLAGADAAAQKQIVDMMERQVNHMVRLVDDLLEVSRITRGKIDLRKEVVDVAAVVRSAVETAGPVVEGAGHQLAISLPPEPVLLEADPVRLAQVVVNLLNNAAKYTEAGGQIWLTARREAGQVALSVRDTGTGIPAEMLPRVFDMFTQVDRTLGRAQGGLGIGLALVRSLVQMHGGSVEARSDGPGRGSEFTVRLPLARSDVRRASENDGVAKSSAALAGRRILVVDDNRDAADSLAMLLRFMGAEVLTAYDGPSALEVVRVHRPAVVFLDLGMPGMDGYAVAAQVRREPQYQDVTLIALTGWGQEEDRRRSREAGFDDHLTKPPDIGALEQLLSPLSVEGQGQLTNVPETPQPSQNGTDRPLSLE
jgi:CheY-like chemotaxis protein